MLLIQSLSMSSLELSGTYNFRTIFVLGCELLNFLPVVACCSHLEVNYNIIDWFHLHESFFVKNKF